MMTQAPDISPGYPSKGKALGPAWSEIWAELTKGGAEFQDCHSLAAEVAPKHGLAPATLVALISRAAKADILEKDVRTLAGVRGPRPRVFYRIPAGQ